MKTNQEQRSLLRKIKENNLIVYLLFIVHLLIITTVYGIFCFLLIRFQGSNKLSDLFYIVGIFGFMGLTGVWLSILYLYTQSLKKVFLILSKALMVFGLLSFLIITTYCVLKILTGKLLFVVFFLAPHILGIIPTAFHAVNFILKEKYS